MYKSNFFQSMLKYVFREFSREYAGFFIQEKEKLRKILETAKIEHVGSTSIKGLGGKGIVDILVGVSRFPEAKKRLEQEKYKFSENGSTQQRLFFSREYSYKSQKRKVHLHLTKVNGRDWEEIIGFRNYLLKHPKLAEQYASIKKEGVKKAWGDGEKYRKHKEKFIRNVISKVVRSFG